MTPDDARRRTSELESLCRERGLPLTTQRRVVFEALIRREDHPSADQLWDELRDRLPGMSRATVYRTLEMLEDLGVISKACHPGAVARYDGRTEAHHHLVCLRCGRMVDIEDHRLAALELPATSMHGFRLSDVRVQLRGTCRECLGEERAHAGGAPRRGRSTGRKPNTGRPSGADPNP